MGNNNKTQAELYREERKKRLAKAAAKKAKTSPKRMKTKRLVKKVVAIVLAVAIALGALVGVLNFFDVPEKVVKVSVDGLEAKISIGEFNYYYYQTWYQTFQAEQQYAQYGMAMTGFNYLETPENQPYTAEAATSTGVSLEDLKGIEEPTWADAIAFAAVNQLVYAKYGAQKATETGIKLTDEEKATVDSQIDQMRASATQNDYSLDRWARLNYGDGVTEKVIRGILTDMQLADKYYAEVTEDTKGTITDDEINKAYEASKADLDVVDLRVYMFSSALKSEDTKGKSEEEVKAMKETAKKEAKEKADKFMAQVKDEASFILEAQSAILTADKDSKDKAEETTLVKNASKAKLSSDYNEDISTWAFDAERKVNDIKLFVDENGNCYAVLLKALPHKDLRASSSDVRHILVQFPTKNTDGTDVTTTDENGNKKTNLTDATKAATLAEAQELLNEFLKNPSEDAFAKLATDKTDDTASAKTGGLYEGVADDGSYVQPFTDWAIDDSRKAGDTGIVETDYGYHIMYYVKSNGEAWKTAAETSVLNEKLKNSLQTILDDITKNINIKSLPLKMATNSQNKRIEDILINNGFKKN